MKLSHYVLAITVTAQLFCLFLAAASHAAELTGTVVDDAGKPLGDAKVWVNQNREVHQDVTSAQGKFKVQGIVPAMTEVVVFKEGYALGGSAAPAQGGEDITIALRPADLISLKTIDLSSNPVAGVKVRSMLIERRTLVSVEDLEPFGFPALRSTDDGILVIPNLPPDGFIQLVLHHPEFADSSIRYLPVDTEQRNIVLERGGRANGRVTHGGAGVAGARVSIFKVGPQGQKEFAEVLTDTEGFFAARVEAGAYRVAVSHPDYAAPAPVALEVPNEDNSAPVALELLTPHFIHGSVVLPGGKPCPGARIQYRIENTIYVDTATGDDGRFELKVPTGKGAVAIQPPQGYMTPTTGAIGVDLGDVSEVTLKPVELEPLPVLTGQIEDGEGKAPGQVIVTALNLPVPFSVITDVPVPFSVLSDSDGHFSIPLQFMPAVEELQLRAEHPLRFQRVDFAMKLKREKPVKAKLAQFTPDLADRPPIPGANNLSGLIGQPAKPLSGDAWVNSDPITLDGLKGKVVVLLFWAGFDESIGPIMLRELHVLHELLKEVDDVAFISVHDAISSKEEIEDYIKYFNIPYPVLRDSNEQTTFSTYNIVFIPQLVLIDKKGVVRYYQTDGRLLELIKGLRRE